jgi:hypothetical protein
MGTREATVWVAGAAWLAAVLGGFWAWERYDTTPGGAGARAAPESGPAADWRLTVFAHPRCPCTRATLHAVAELASAGMPLSVRVVFVRPADRPEGWERGESWETAGRIAGVDLACDPAGAEARRFGAETSGHAVLTDPTGRVVFRGGLTRARGRTGESAGRRAVAEWVGTGSGVGSAPVYGCPLFAPPDGSRSAE